MRCLLSTGLDTGDQVTQYISGTTLADSDVARSDLLRRVLYPDSTGEEDSVEHGYNRQGERRGRNKGGGTKGSGAYIGNTGANGEG